MIPSDRYEHDDVIQNALWDLIQSPGTLGVNPQFSYFVQWTRQWDMVHPLHWVGSREGIPQGGMFSVMHSVDGSKHMQKMYVK